jgi:hypothetical protein
LFVIPQRSKESHEKEEQPHLIQKFVEPAARIIL